MKASSDLEVRVSGWCLCAGMFRVKDPVSHRQSSGPCQGQARCLSFPFGTGNSLYLCLWGKKPTSVPTHISVAKHHHEGPLRFAEVLKRFSVFDQQREIIPGSGSGIDSSGDPFLTTERG